MSKAESSGNRNGLEVAVVGMAGRFPGAETVEQFWRNLRDGVESISFFTDEEVLAAGADPELLKHPNFVRAGGVLAGVELFDAGFFGYSPREAEIIDPQQRLFLECAWEALEHAGHGPATCREPVGVFAGTGTSGYVINIYSNPEHAGAANPFQVANGNDKDYLATRVSYKLDLKGPGVTVQTACSTSLVAVHLACQSLLSGACDMALAGGVTVSATQKSGYLYQEGGILSPDGHVRTFDARARGCVGGSGVGVVVLRRLEDALADGDTVYAVIKGSAVNNDGSEKVGFTAPSVGGQAAVIRAALDMAEVEPGMVSYVEAHGTATPLGDPVEVAGLTQAFGGRASRGGSCALGSVKTNVGHLDAAAGVAGLIKTALALKHRQIPPSLNFAEGNPQIDFAAGPFYVNAALREWDAGGRTRYAGVSSFGIGGTNCHVVLEEPPPDPPPAASRPWQLLLLSARTKNALDESGARLAGALRQDPPPHLPDVAYTLQAGRGRLAHRRALVCRDAAEAAAALEPAAAGDALTGFQEAQDAPVVFMFPGQGAQRVDMGLELYRSERTFREHVDLCGEILRPHLGLDLRDVLYPPPQRADEAEAALRQTQLAQAALFVVESGLAALWGEWGVRPSAMIGHSLGEYVAAYLAGVFTLEAALGLVAARGRLMQGLAPGAMLAVPLPEGEVRGLLREDPRLSLAAVNGPSHCVVSGPREATEALASRLSGRDLNCRTLHTSHAFHSRMMEPALKPFEEAVRGLRLSPPRVPYVSNLSGTWVTAGEAVAPEYWARHLRETVRFGDGLGELLKAPNSVLLELGPGDTLSALGARHPAKAEGHAFVPSLHEGRAAGGDRSELRATLRALGRAWIAGAAVDWEGFARHERRRRVPLPTYPFERRRYWIERRKDLAALAAAPAARGGAPEEPFHVPVWKQSVAPALLGAEPPSAPGSVWLLFLDGAGVGRGLAEQLRREGSAVVTVEPGPRFARAGVREYAIDPARREDYEALFRELRAASLGPDYVVHLWALDPDDGRADSAARVARAQERGFYSLLWLAQALGEELLEGGLGAKSPARRIAVVSGGLHKAPGDAGSRPEMATLLGPCRVIPQEYPNLTCRSIDLGPDALAGGDARGQAARLLAELRAEGPEQVVAYRDGARWVPDFEPVRLKGREGMPPRLRERGVYLITGGLGGVGLEAAEYLARTAGARLALLGRAEFPEREDWPRWLAERGDDDPVGRKIKRLQAVEALGGEVLTLSADVTSVEQLRAAVGRATHRFGPVNGVIHAAGLPPGVIIQRTTREAAAGVLAPKLEGALAVAELFRDAGLDFLLLCSSIRSLAGGAGAAAYCAANAFLDAFAHSAPLGRGTFVTAVNWDGWLDTGMSLRPARRAESGPGGEADGMTAPECVAALHRILCSSLPQVVVSKRTPAEAAERERALTAAEVIKQFDPAPGAAAAHPRPELETPYAPPRDPAEQTLADIWQSLLGIDRVGVHDNFFDLGGDSIVSIQIIGKARQAGLRLTPKQIFEHQTIAELAAVSAGAGAEAEQGLVAGPVPLTPVQHWFFEQELPAPHHFNQAVLLRTREALDYGLLKRAVSELLLQHDALRFRFTREGGVWRQEGTGDGDAPCERFDLSGVPAGERAAAVGRLAAELQAGLDLTAGPLLRVALLDLGAGGGARLLVVIHHLVMDALSWHILLEDLQCAYGQLGRGEPVRLAPKTTSFKRWAELLAAHARSGALDGERDFWLAGERRAARPLPLDYPAGENVAASARDVTVELSAEETLALTQEFTRRRHAQVNEALLAALAESFAAWQGGAPLLVDLEGHGREPVFEGVDLSRTVGWFTNIYPVLLSREAGEGAALRLARVREQLRRVPGGGLGYGLLRYLSADAAAKEALRALPRAEVSFLYLGQFDHALPGSSLFEPAPESSGPHRDLRGARSHLFEVVAGINDGRLRVTWIYSGNLHRAATVEKLASDFMDALRALAAADPPAPEPDFAAFGWSREEFDDLLRKLDDAVR